MVAKCCVVNTQKCQTRENWNYSLHAYGFCSVAVDLNKHLSLRFKNHRSFMFKTESLNQSSLTSLCLNISCMLMPSVLRTVSFSPVFVVFSPRRQRVKPLVSMMTAFWASVDKTEVRSKCTLLTGKTRSTYEWEYYFNTIGWGPRTVSWHHVAGCSSILSVFFFCSFCRLITIRVQSKFLLRCSWRNLISKLIGIWILAAQPWLTTVRLTCYVEMLSVIALSNEWPKVA